MINDKYRVNEVAKDLNVQMKDIVDLLEKNFPGEKKRTTVLTNEELNFVFETYTQQHQQDNLDSYYAYKVQSQPVKQEKAAAPKNGRKTAEGRKRSKRTATAGTASRSCRAGKAACSGKTRRRKSASRGK